VLASVFWDEDGSLPADYLEKGATVTEMYYVALRDKLKQKLVSKHRCKVSNGTCFYKKILFSQCGHYAIENDRYLKYPAYSIDFGPFGILPLF
jgi:hypothetical protein